MGFRPYRYPRGAWLLPLVMLVSRAWSVCAAETPLVDLSADGLATGELAAWENKGAAGGAFSAGGEQKPVVAEVNGRRAVQFGTKRWMKSSFKTPQSLTGNQPYTLMVWAHVTKLAGKEVLVAWASRPKDSAEFGYGSNRSEGAFCSYGLGDLGFGPKRAPEPGKWHHIAFVHTTDSFRLHVDGELTLEKPITLKTKEGENLWIGAAWDSKKDEACFFFSGAIAQVRIYDRALPEREIRNAVGRYEPFSPTPADGSTVDNRTQPLRWQSGSTDARAFRVFLSTKREPVEDGNAGVLLVAKDGKPEATEIAPSELVLGETYYWRVDEHDATGKLLARGPVWTFALSAGPATNPQPRNRVAGVKMAVAELAWKPGRYAVTQSVHFGTDADAVVKSSTPTAKDLSATAAKLAVPLPLEYSKTYFWRVDQHNGNLPSRKGDVWAFRVEDEPIPDDVTFFVVSDTHYGLDSQGDMVISELVDSMNWLPGTTYPDSAGGGVVRTPRGVIHIGDTNNDSREEQWQTYARDFGVNGEARLAFPLYEGFGNHDGKAEIRAKMKERTTRRVGLAAVSENGLHYSWDWGPLHLIHLNVWPGSTGKQYDPAFSLEFLKQDPAARAANGKPVALFHHFGFDSHSLGWWTDEARAAYYDAIKGANVAGIFHGHDHETRIYKWKEFDIFDTPHWKMMDENKATAHVTHGFFVVHVTPDEMTVATRNSDHTWGKSARKRLQAPTAKP